MDITPLVASTASVITGYGAGGFAISGARYDYPVLVLPEQVLAWEGAPDPASLPDHLPEPIELLLIGTGESMQPLPPALRQRFRARCVAVETMDTGAACRTFNVLLAEGRRVAAALIAV